MTILTRHLMVCLALLAPSLLAQDTNQFQAYGSIVNLVEGGRVPIVIIDWGDLRFTMRNPVGFSSHVDNDTRSIRFDAKSGAVALTMTLTTNSPGQLPAADDLKAWAISRHPGAWPLQSYPLPTSFKPGFFVDLAQVPAPNVSLRIRHAFVPTPKGLVEFVFSAKDSDFDKMRVGVMQSIATFTAEPIKPKETAQH